MVSDERSGYKSWSNLKKQMHDLLCDSLKDKILYFYTSYHEVHNAYGRATVNYNKKEMVAFSWVEMYAQEREVSQLYAEGKKVSVILGFNTKSEIFYEEEFKKIGCDVTVTTVDGSYGVKGFVTTALECMDYSYFYTCGPEPMLKAVHKASRTSGQMSFEERMGCGFGACMGCSCKTLTGYKRICKEGPVMKKEEILWD